MKINLKPNWSEQFIYGDDTPGFFVGREQEIKALKNVIAGNNSSAVLISSVRGIGKTSFIHKALSEIDEVHPVFVNIGHALANADNENSEGTKNKKLILVSLIRATRFNKEFDNDKELEDLYRKCFAKVREENIESDDRETKQEIGISGEIKTNAKNLIPIFEVFILALGISLDSLWVRLILGSLGATTLFLSFGWQKKIVKALLNRKSSVIDDSTEYLEIEFENWLRKKKDKKLVFVID